MQTCRNDAALRVAGRRRRGAVRGLENVFERVRIMGRGRPSPVFNPLRRFYATPSAGGPATPLRARGSRVVFALTENVAHEQLVLRHDLLMDFIVRKAFCCGEDTLAEEFGDREFRFLVMLEDLPENRKVFQFGNPADHANILREIWHVGKQNFTFSA